MNPPLKSESALECWDCVGHPFGNRIALVVASVAGQSALKMFSSIARSMHPLEVQPAG
jgi:hypothetical protein